LLIRTRDGFLRILEWNFRIWKKIDEYKDCKDGKKKMIWVEFNNIKYILTSIIQKIEERSFKEKQSLFFFDKIKKHIEIKKDTPQYIDDLFQVFFYALFFETMEEMKNFSERYNVWRSFPEEWKITKNNLSTRNEARLIWRYFKEWFYYRIIEYTEEYDAFLDNVIINLFPKVEPITWATILLFIYSSYNPEKGRIKSIIEKKWHFGHIVGREYSGFGVSDEDIERNERMKKNIKKATYELALFLFKEAFKKENLEKYIEELKNLDSKDSIEEKHRVALLDIFNNMLNILKNKNTKIS
jgi:hypothetical protein